jgi:hypothetical protein
LIRTRLIKRIAYYISSHGYGHAARSLAVLETLANQAKVFVKTEIPSSFFQNYFGDSIEVIAQQTDSGCAQKNFSDIDEATTFHNLRNFLKNRDQIINSEINWLKQESIDLIISDAASLPLEAAYRSDIPSLLIANFTWHDIYSEFSLADKHSDLIDILKEGYSKTTLQILPQCHIVNNLVPKKMESGFIGLGGNNIRNRLNKELHLDFYGKTAVFIYLGEQDSSFLEWENLVNIKDCLFFTRDAIQANVKNLFVLDSSYDYRDLIASSDLVCTKAGYSTLATAFISGVPIFSSDRQNFSEAKIVKKFLKVNQVGNILGNEPFFSCDWEETIKKTRSLSVKGKVLLHGEKTVLSVINDWLNTSF